MSGFMAAAKRLSRDAGGRLRYDLNGSTVPVGIETQYGTDWYVDGGGATAATSQYGADVNEGKSWVKAFLTMAECFTHIASGDRVHFRGNVREQIDTPAGVFDVTVIGHGNRPRHADAHGAHTTYGGYSSATWKAPATPTAGTPLVRVRQQGWRFINVLFVGSSSDTTSCVRLFRDAGSGDAEDDASHAEFVGCRFAGGLYGIEDHGGCANVGIYACTFQQFSNSGDIAIKSTVGAGVGTLWGWEIEGNRFLANETDISAGLSNAIIVDNHFMLTALSVTNTVAISLTGTNNWIARNHMHGASDHNGVNARFVLGSGDMYAGNYWSDKEEYAEPAS